MVDVNTQNKTISVNVSSSGVSSNVNASGDATLYYSNKAREWATSNRIVDGVDYSSKYYAQESKASADMAKTYETSTQENYNMFMEASVNANSELQTNRDGALADIEGAKTSAIDSLNSVKDENIASIEAKANEALTNIETNRDETLSSIENSRSASVSEITSLSNGYISQINTTGKSYDNLTHRNITNCITEIPQRIKLELTDGVLTLKAGSEVIIPNGFEEDGTTPKFDYVKTNQDYVYTPPNTLTAEVILTFLLEGSNSFGDAPRFDQSGSNIYSGDTAPTATSSMTWWDTKNNIIKTLKSGTGVWVETRTALPIAFLKVTNGNIDSCKVFNGMGYIGSTVWVDKGVKGLIPDGRNEDGTLNNIEFTTDKVTTVSVSDPIKYFGIKLEGSLKAGVYGDWLYNENSNAVQIGNVIYTWMYAGTLTCSNGKITSFNPKQPFRAMDYSDKSDISGWGMPSNKYIDLTLGASGTLYTAPANGWVYFNKIATATNQNLAMGANGLGFSIFSSSASQWLSLTMPIQKGRNFYVSYTANGATNTFRFHYAQGEV